tara:strand:- start:1059 stop:2261 length:1203 start_codon:yes stop_codon:yes gene_type:complete
MVDIHNYRKRLVRTLENIEKSDLSQEDKNIITRFHDTCLTEGLSICKLERYLYDLLRFANMLEGSLKNATKEGIRKVVVGLEKKEWTSNSKRTFKIMIRKFYRTIEEIDESGVYPERVRWIKPNSNMGQKKLPEDLLNDHDVQKMLEVSEDLRDRALIAVLYESGCRIGEVGSMKIKNIVFDDHGAVISVFGKTGSRRIRLVYSVPYLQEWINNHPVRSNRESFVWINRQTKSFLSYARLVAIIKRIGKKAGIEKRIHPHLFRHSRATLLASHLTEAQMKSYLGWTQSSKMAAIYVHLSGRDTDDAILKMNGLAVKEKKEEGQIIRNLDCQRCQTRNEYTNKFCKLCGLVLDKGESQRMVKFETDNKDMGNLIGSLLKDKDVMNLIAEKMKENEMAVAAV